MKPLICSSVPIFSLGVNGVGISWNGQLVSLPVGSQACSFMSGLGYVERVALFTEEVLTQPAGQGF